MSDLMVDLAPKTAHITLVFTSKAHELGPTSSASPLPSSWWPSAGRRPSGARDSSGRMRNHVLKLKCESCDNPYTSYIRISMYGKVWNTSRI